MGLHRSNLAGLRRALHALAPPAEACLVDGFRLGPSAPEHMAVVDGDERSAAIAAASIVAKVVRDRTMRRLDALYPALRLLVARRLHHARSFRGSCGSAARARSTAAPSRRSAISAKKSRPRHRGLVRVRSERARSGVRRGTTGCAGIGSWRRTPGRAATSSISSFAAGERVVFCEVKAKGGPRSRRPARDGHAGEAAAPAREPPRPGSPRTRSSAGARFGSDVVAERAGKVERIANAF